ncbi:hypothetical protein [Pseudomonas rubra]|uniref:DUF4879 domain-containing protein n=1 Tax=Pseudomonas rubra TaxID=2942627 RepID=A0ABT5P1W3_9PSED|nr:hypothetical protein [Pseudomonas rubra]MDD1012268.1 hypothetical protein [Pseudomonas rubra]MDD1037385.1 hypothetical protein [Pseudomonas rubra]MDD1153102.1 hypothetical protein [Pseudomonas rubra]
MSTFQDINIETQSIPGLPAGAVLFASNAQSSNTVLPGQSNRSGPNFIGTGPRGNWTYYVVSKGVTGSMIMRGDLPGNDSQFGRIVIERANTAYSISMSRPINLRGFYASNPQNFSNTEMRFDVYYHPISNDTNTMVE